MDGFGYQRNEEQQGTTEDVGQARRCQTRAALFDDHVLTLPRRKDQSSTWKVAAATSSDRSREGD